MFMGNGDTAGLHHPAYDFTDDAIPHGMSSWIKLTETALAAWKGPAVTSPFYHPSRHITFRTIFTVNSLRIFNVSRSIAVG
jgi:hypothetical protein